jgi:micrococcal nuclease
MRQFLSALLAAGSLAACNLTREAAAPPPGAVPDFDETGRVIQIIDGDTIDVDINGSSFRVRYVGINTPERGEPCYDDATNANARLVSGQIVGLVRDHSNTDQYGRLLRYIYVGGTFVNRELITGGYAEAVKYGSDDRHWAEFVALERAAASAGRGCHPTGIFDDGSDTR